ncbi:MAG: HAD family hydrolase [Vulcanibacillus sp.]
MSKALLIDLDGTLLQADTEEFVKQYMKSLTFYIKDYYNPEKFIQAIWESTEEMIKNLDSNLTNKEVFSNHFIEKSGVIDSEVWPLFERFYLEQFPKLKGLISTTTISKNIVEIAKKQGRKVVVATNPLFPKDAIVERLRWLELDNFPFDLITAFEDSHFCKPHVLYFEEILDKISTKPEDAIMIGNDMQEDMVASELGMSTYLVKDYLIDRGSRSYTVNQSGTLVELKEQLQKKIGVFC